MEVAAFKGPVWQCSQCEKRFSTGANLETHTGRAHSFVFDKKKTMSIARFLEELRKTPRAWGLSVDGRIVFNGEDVCPISAVAGLLLEGEPYSEAEDYESAKKLNLSPMNAGKIIRAADNAYVGGGYLRHRNFGALRSELLDACGIVDEGELYEGEDDAE